MRWSRVILLLMEITSIFAAVSNQCSFFSILTNEALQLQRGKHYITLNAGNCPDKTSIKLKLNLTDSGKMPNKVLFSGMMMVEEEVKGPIDMIMEANRCDLKMNNCEIYQRFKITKMCDKFNDKNAFYAGGLTNITPSLRCPIKAGNYTFVDSILDLSALSPLPLDGYIWIVLMKWVSGESGKNPRLVFCFHGETKILKNINGKIP